MTSMKPGATHLLLSQNKGMLALNMGLNVACTAAHKTTSLLCSTELPTARAARSAEATDAAELNPRQTSVSQTFLFFFPSLSALFKTQGGKGEGEEAQIMFQMKINAVVPKPVSSCCLSSSPGHNTGCHYLEPQIAS